MRPNKYGIHVDCVMRGFRSMRFEHESIACLSLEFLYEIKFKAGLLAMVIYGCCLNNVLINSVKSCKKLDFETLLRKSCSLNSESKGQVICGCENFNLGRTASFSVKILFNRQIFRTTQFHSRGGCCVRLTSVCCAYF